MALSQKKPAPAYLDLAAASAHAGLSVRTLRRFITQGRLPAYRPGGKILVRRIDLERLITSARVHAFDLDALAAEALRELGERS